MFPSTLPEQVKHLLQYGKSFQTVRLFYIFIIINHDTFVVNEIWFRIIPEKITSVSKYPNDQLQDSLAIIWGDYHF
jgi:hypothetical protein